MNGAEDDLSFLPTELDLIRLEQLQPDKLGVLAESNTWTALRYPPLPYKGWRWAEYVLVLHVPPPPGFSWFYDVFKTHKAIVSFLHQIEAARLKSRK